MHTVLIVDDHRKIRRLLRISVGKDVAILEAEDGPGAMVLIERHRPTMVFLDVMMPGLMNGFDVLQAIRSNPATRQTVVAMTTACSQVDDHNRADAHGANAYFTKPFSLIKVGNWLREQVGPD